MSRDSGRIDALPFQTWTVRVDDQQRVRVSSDVQATVPWLQGLVETSVDCVALPGPLGGIQLHALAAFESESGELLKALGDRVPAAKDAGDGWVSLGRLFGTARVVAVLVEKTRLSFKLPESIRTARHLPGAGGSVVIFGFGSVLEIWDSDRFYDHVQSVAKLRAAMLSQAIEDLGST